MLEIVSAQFFRLVASYRRLNLRLDHNRQFIVIYNNIYRISELFLSKLMVKIISLSLLMKFLSLSITGCDVRTGFHKCRSKNSRSQA